MGNGSYANETGRFCVIIVCTSVQDKFMNLITKVKATDDIQNASFFKHPKPMQSSR